MSVGSTLYTGQSGLAAHGEAISVVGDNIANANTVGFKQSRANFEDVFARSLGGGGGTEPGLGTRLGDVQKVLTQGALIGTGLDTDLAIKGDGFFVVKGTHDGTTSNFYTRAGQFHLDADDNLVNQGGLVVQGYAADSNGVLVRNVVDINISSAQVPPVATTTVSMVGNLDSDATEPANPFVVTDPQGTSNFSTSTTVYDSLGKAHTVNVYFRRENTAVGTDNETWDWFALVDGGEITGGTAGTPEIEASGQLGFGTNGELTRVGTPTIDFDFLNATQSQQISFDFGTQASGGTGGLDGMTNFQSTSSISFTNQDGSSSGELSGVSISSDGIISGVFSNGLQRTVGQVLLASFQSPQDLQRVGGNTYLETVDSGQALIGEPATAGRGSVSSGSLEQSNVDLSRQFVDMIAFQRGFQANSRTVMTADQMMQEVLGIKR